MTAELRNPRAGWVALSLLAALSATILGVSWHFYETQRASTESLVHDQLILAAEAKARQLAAWRDDRLGMARTIVANPLNAAGLREIFLQPDNLAAQARATVLCQAWLEHLRHAGIYMVAADGSIVLSAGRPLASNAHLRDTAVAAIASAGVTFIDMHADSDGPAHFGFALPVRSTDGARNLGVVLLISDPRTVIDPIMSAWPTPGASGETLLVRRDGDGVLYLSDLRYRRNAGGKLRLPLTLTDTPAVQAVTGRLDVRTGIDYRGVPVLSAARPVPGTTWFVVAKQDRDEAYAPVRRRAWQWALTGLGFWLAASMAILLHWRRHQSRERLRRYREDVERQALRGHYDLLSRYANDAILVIDPETRIVETNERTSTLYGYSREELLSMSIFDLRPPAQRAQAQANWDALMARGSLVFEAVHQRKDGRLLFVEVSSRRIHAGSLYYHQSIVRDIGERKQAEEEQQKLRDQLNQAQKMESIGRLAGGVAHDFNNHLTVINGYSEMLLSDLAPSDPHREPLREILRAGQMAANLTRQLLVFGRKSIIDPRPLAINEVITETRRMLERVLGEDIQLVTLLADDLPRMTADLGQLNQILMNLAVNAREAMPGGGKIIIETSRIDLDEDYAAQHSGVEPGAYILLAFSDTGMGMSPEVQRHIFEPFFTTKGTGTGLGLATVYGIVRQSQGHIWVYSEPGKGTTFKLYFPALQQRRPTPAAEPAPHFVAGGTVLVVDDHEPVRRIEAETLRRHGFTVIEAGSAEAAIERMSAAPIHLRLLVTDVVLPGISGRDLARHLTTTQPDLPVLYTSGYTENVIAHSGMLDAGVQYLPKPITPDSLTGKLKEILRQAP